MVHLPYWWRARAATSLLVSVASMAIGVVAGALAALAIDPASALREE
jgi:ABC-type spermidine/putrescine transport system permease subunit II